MLNQKNILNPEYIFVRKFRWTLEAEDFTGHFVKKAHVDYRHKTITVHLYQIHDGKKVECFEWIDTIPPAHALWHGENPDEQLSQGKHLTLTTYDGCGNALYSVDFYNVKLSGEETDFDYAVSDEAVEIVYLSFERHERKVHQKKDRQTKKCQTKEPTNEWFLTVQGNNELSSIPVKLSKRPNITIEEIEINSMSMKTRIPGKGSWEKLKLHFEDYFGDNPNFYKVAGRLIAGEHMNLSLDLKDSNQVELERWELSNIKLDPKDCNWNDLDITVSFNEVKYQSYG